MGRGSPWRAAAALLLLLRLVAAGRSSPAPARPGACPVPAAAEAVLGPPAQCKPNFEKLAHLFPTIRHFAFEESAIRPSIISRYGIHGFPTLFLLNSTMRVRYHGPRTVKPLAAFYSDVSGINASMESITGEAVHTC
ncbi:hypothetical protein ZWY2020_022632 [Hordeum vulgare]|nr:hypothetical protein ZWY2020_022632 [Hordeum vulgare]